jgi:hypothetical protein
MLAHITTSMQTLLTITLVQVTNAFYIASCLLVSLLMYILNINNRTRYSNTWVKPQQYYKLQRYLKQWRFMLAHLNKHIDIFFKTNCRVSAYHIKTNFHSKQLTWRPYGHKKWEKAHTVRTQCLKYRALCVDPEIRLSMQSTMPTPH